MNILAGSPSKLSLVTYFISDKQAFVNNVYNQ